MARGTDVARRGRPRRFDRDEALRRALDSDIFGIFGGSALEPVSDT
jgi:hypothetical protein